MYIKLTYNIYVKENFVNIIINHDDASENYYLKGGYPYPANLIVININYTIG